MTGFTYEKTSPRLVMIRKDGAFAGWANMEFRRTSGLHSKRQSYWTALVAGQEVNASTLTGIKAKLESR